MLHGRVQAMPHCDDAWVRATMNDWTNEWAGMEDFAWESKQKGEGVETGGTWRTPGGLNTRVNYRRRWIRKGVVNF